MSLRRSCALLLPVFLASTPLLAQDVVVVQSNDRLLNANFEDVYSVGAFDGAPWETFGGIEGLAFDAEGRLYIFDRQSSRIVVVDRQGALVREMGQAGEGPGELRMPMAFTVLRDGTTVIADVGHRAYSVFGPDGSYDHMVSMGGGGGMIRLGDMQADPTGLAVLSGGGGMSIQMGPGDEAGPTTRPVERISLTGEEAEVEVVVDGWLPPREERDQEMSGGGMSFSMASGPRTWEPGLYTGVLPDGGIVYADTSTYTVKVADAHGVLERVIHRPMESRPVTSAMEEAEKERRLAELEEGEGPRMQIVMAGPGGQRQSVNQEAIKEMMRGRVDQMQFYPELSLITGLSTGWEGTIWVERRGEEPEGPGPVDLLRPDGGYVGTFAAGETEVPMAFGPDGLVAFTVTDEFDVPTVVVRRLPEPIR